ncbi:hypothetical protein GQ600_27033 [Phytophthora cactorum]|nr:hypothetical protein GQ600_27033 [Phytophthora cactorum]
MNPSYDQVNFSVGYFQGVTEMDADFQASIIQEERRCRYPSKRCEFPRAIKRNGEMHRFCDGHRNKANLNQRRLELRRKREMEEKENSRRKRRSTSADSENSTDQPFAVDGIVFSPLHSVLAQDELNYLSELLSQNSLDDLHAGTEVDSSANSFSI